MKLKTVRLDPETRRVLLASTIDGNRLKLPGQLPPKDYQRVAKVVNVKQTFQAFYTPSGVASQVCELADLGPRHTLLEPSASSSRADGWLPFAPTDQSNEKPSPIATAGLTLSPARSRKAAPTSRRLSS